MDENPEANIQVYAVWFNMLPNDVRQRADLNLIPAPRTTELWNEQRLAGRFFAENEGFNFGKIVYDVYYLYCMRAEWDFNPASLVSSEYTILGKKNQLRDDTGCSVSKLTPVPP